VLTSAHSQFIKAIGDTHLAVLQKGPDTTYRHKPLVGLIIPKKGINIPKMGIQSTSLGGALFTKTQQRVLALLFGNPDRSHYTNEIVRFADAGIGTVQRELQRLESAGVIMSRKIGNQKHYQANREAAIFEELRGIVVKTFGVADRLRAALEPLKSQILAAFIFGSVAKGTDTANSDIDVMVIADKLDYPQVIEALSKAEDKLGRPVSPSLYTLAEWHRKFSEESGFVKRVMGQPKVFVLGSESEIVQTR
jgi:predicted nucleotidyltransferase